MDPTKGFIEPIEALKDWYNHIMEDQLPFNSSQYPSQTESVGTTVYLPKNKESQVVKVSKRDMITASLIDALREVKELKEREEVAMKVASTKTIEAIIPQEYVLAHGSIPNSTKSVRTQKFIEGTPLKELGFSKIIRLDEHNIKTLKSILKDSMICYIKHGTNYDIFGSDERDVTTKSRKLNIKRLIFPLRNSSNLLLTQNGIKLIDPNVLGSPNKRTPKSFALQTLLFVSSGVNYALLSLGERLQKSSTKTVPV